MEGGGPELILGHAVGNILMSIRVPALTDGMKRDVMAWRAIWPGVEIVWSGIIQRGSWSKAMSTAIERVRRKVSKTMRGFMGQVGGKFVNHMDVDIGCFGL